MRLAFVPSAPFLLLDAGPDELRAAIGTALTGLDGEVVVVGGSPVAGWQTGTVDVTPYGVAGEPAADPLPLALAVGSHLLAGRPHRLWGVPSGPLPPADALLVVADGSAKRSEKAPGHLDPRAEEFDATVVAALGSGDPRALRGLDAAVAEELWAAGVPAWGAIGGLPGTWRAEVLYAGAPYGVGYVVATWA